MKKQMKHRTADEHRVWGRVVDAAFLGHQAFRLNIMKVSGWQRLLATGMGTWGNLSTPLSAWGASALLPGGGGMEEETSGKSPCFPPVDLVQERKQEKEKQLRG